MNSSNASVSSCLQESFTAEIFPTEPQMVEQEIDDTSLEWLSIFMEDCLSGTTNFSTLQNVSSTAPSQPKNSKISSSCEWKLPSKARTMKKRKFMNLIEEENCPLLPRSYWLADSELILPQKLNEGKKKAEVGGGEVGKQQDEGQPRKCTHCLSQKTPQWRAGPMGPKTLCNACGVRFKSGRLLPEYRPAKSPTFVSYKHSNSHKKVLEMRMASLSSNSS